MREPGCEVGREPLALGAEEEGERRGEIGLPDGLATVGREGHRASGHRVPRDERHPEDRPRRRAQRLRRQRVGAAVGEGDGGAERIRGADERADVPRVGEPPEREAGVARRLREVRAPVDADRARGVRQRRHAGEELRLHGLARDEQVDGLDAGDPRRVHEVLALDGEEAGLVAVLALPEELPDELQRRVVTRGDHAASLPETGRGSAEGAADAQAAFASPSCGNAALAFSATAANAFGSATARSASDFRSSSIPAPFRPCMNWL